MAYREFSTEKADYYLCFNLHQVKQKDDIFSNVKIKSLDAVILELSDHATPDIKMENGGRWPVPYLLIKEQIESFNPQLPIYFVDAFPKNTLIRYLEQMAIPLVAYGISKATGIEEISSAGIVYFFGLQIIAHGFSSLGAILGETKVCPRIVSAVGLLPPTEVIELRNAIAAKKIEEAIAPRYKHRPKIAIVYGGGHAGIEDCLKSKRRRDGIIGLFRKLNFPAMEKSTIDKITRAAYNHATNLWDFERQDAHCI